MGRRTSSLLVLTLLVSSIVLLGAECEEEPQNAPERVVDRTDVPPIEEDDGGTVWESSPWIVTDEESEGFIRIEPDTRLKLCHGLGRDPIEIHAWVGFSPTDARLMPASGNAAEIWDVGSAINDGEGDHCRDVGDSYDYITVRNGSGGSFYYRFVLR